MPTALKPCTRIKSRQLSPWVATRLRCGALPRPSHPKSTNTCWPATCAAAGRIHPLYFAALEVPAQAEIAIEGYVDLNDYRPEGPFGDHTGYYTPVESFPTFKVTAITHRKDPIYPATVVGIPPMEDAWMGKATERLFLPLIRLFMPEILDVHMPAEGVFHNLVLVRLAKRYPGHARKVIHGLWGLGLLTLAKTVVVVDEWVDVQNLSQTAWQALGNVDWQRDIVLGPGPVDQLDHASTQQSYGGKIGVLQPPNCPRKDIPAVGRGSCHAAEVKQRIDDLWVHWVYRLVGFSPIQANRCSCKKGFHDYFPENSHPVYTRSRPGGLRTRCLERRRPGAHRGSAHRRRPAPLRGPGRRLF